MMSELTVTSMKDTQKLSFDEMTLLYRRFMQLIGLLPLNGGGYSNLTTRVLLVFFFTTSIIQWSSALFYVINEGVSTIDSICEMVIMVGYNARYYLLLCRRQELFDLLEECQAIWKNFDEEGQRAARQFEPKVRLLFKGILGSCLFCSAMYSSLAISMTLEASHNNVTQIKYLPFKWYAEGAEDSWPGYKFNFVLQVIIGVNGAIVLTSVDTAAPLFIMIGAGYFRALQLRLYYIYQNAITENNDHVADRELVACVRLHQHILRIDRITRSLFFVQLLTTVYNTSLLGIKLVGTDPDRYKYVMVAFLNVGQLFLCQWAPDHLIQESTAISTTAYSVSLPWIERCIGKVLVLMIARAQRPVQMTAAGFVYLSHEKFGEMLKGAVSFFAVLRSFTV